MLLTIIEVDFDFDVNFTIELFTFYRFDSLICIEVTHCLV